MRTCTAGSTWRASASSSRACRRASAGSGSKDRARLGLAFNEMVAKGELSAPIVIGRDHLDSGSVASPNRETEAMQDGSDAVSDWAFLNALLNTAGGATWVSIHHGGGVGMGFSQHAGVVIVCDGTRRGGRAHRARAAERPRHRRHAPRRRRLRARDRLRARAGPRPALGALMASLTAEARLRSRSRSCAASSRGARCGRARPTAGAVRSRHRSPRVRARLAAGESLYGINTGFGKLAKTRISDDELATLQLYLMRSHAAGVGAPLADSTVRLILVLKAASLARGFSGRARRRDRATARARERGHPSGRARRRARSALPATLRRSRTCRSR